MASQPKEIAAGVYCLAIGRGLMQSNVYLVRSGTSWVLIDAAWPGAADLIVHAAESLFGANARPAAILLTHAHPDHAGCALELARVWDVPVYVHPAELPVAAGGKAALQASAGPLDRWVIRPLTRLLPRGARAAMLDEHAAFKEVVRAYDPDTGAPGLAEWQCIPTPGHTPGHVAFFREHDRVLITGDAVLTVNLNSLWDALRNTQRVSGPPYITTWSWPGAKESVAELARLEPRVLACGHGVPMTEGAAEALRTLTGRFSGPQAAHEAASGAGEQVPASASGAERMLFALSAAGVPIGCIAHGRLGRLGGLLLEVAIGALGVRAGVMLAEGTARRLQAMPRLLLYGETAVDGLAVAAGFLAWIWLPFLRPLLLKQSVGHARRRGWRRARPRPQEISAGWVAQVAFAAWMAAMVLHTARMAIYISPGRGLRKGPTGNA